MKFIQFLKRLLNGPRTWQTITEGERQKAMSKSTAKQRRLRWLPRSRRKDIGPFIPGEGSYFNSENRALYAGNKDTAMARPLAEEREALLEESQRRAERN